ncbi:MAG: hypothetical protein F4187_05070 [Gemmatimonadetes bacterium]|nr:hypothetical protein [Gemmatimonadota bacterium]MYJ95815.1 hypothetical protein [Pseudomonadota bacterium]
MPTSKRAGSFLEVYDEWAAGRITQTQAAERMDVAVRTFRRYVAKYRAGELKLLEDGSIDRYSALRAPDEETAELVRLYRQSYPGWNVRHFYEAYRDRHDGRRSRSWVRKCLKGEATGAASRGNGKRPSPTLQPTDCQDDGPVQTKREGVLLHQLGSCRAWIPGVDWHLTVTFDDATRRVYSGFFAERRTIRTAFRGIRETVEGYGLFECLALGVKSGEYWDPGPSGVPRRHHPQFHRAMSDLGIEVSKRPPTVLARAMRLFGTLTGRLPQELNYRNIERIKEANEFLEDYWPRFNDAFPPRSTGPPGFVAPSPNMLRRLDDIFRIKERGQSERTT